MKSKVLVQRNRKVPTKQFGPILQLSNRDLLKQVPAKGKTKITFIEGKVDF